MSDIRNIGGEYNQTVSYGPPRWMMSFADLMSVILTFFVLLFSLSPSKPAINKAINKENNLTQTSPAAYSAKKNLVPTNIKTAKTDQGLSTNYLADIIKNKIASSPALSKAKLENLDDRLVISLVASTFDDKYAPGIADILKGMNNKSVIYSASLDQSYAVMHKLQEFGLDKNISFFESDDFEGKIDIVIYP